MNLASPFLETLRAQGKAVAIREPGGHATTYAELVSQRATFQHHLRQRGFQSGDVVVHSDTLYTGYLGQPERPPREGLHTGDPGRIVQTSNGDTLELLGRVIDMIVRAGVNAYPTTIEPDLRAITGAQGRRLLREAARVGLWDPAKQDEAIVLCYQPMAGVNVKEHALKGAVETVRGDDARPDFYLLVDPIPVTGRQNKIDKEALRELAMRRFGLARWP